MSILLPWPRLWECYPDGRGMLIWPRGRPSSGAAEQPPPRRAPNLRAASLCLSVRGVLLPEGYLVLIEPLTEAARLMSSSAQAWDRGKESLMRPPVLLRTSTRGLRETSIFIGIQLHKLVSSVQRHEAVCTGIGFGYYGEVPAVWAVGPRDGGGGQRDLRDFGEVNEPEGCHFWGLSCSSHRVFTQPPPRGLPGAPQTSHVLRDSAIAASTNFSIWS